MFVTPGIVVDGELITTDLVEINLGHPHLSRQLVLRRLDQRRAIREERSARQSDRSAASVESNDDGPSAEARFRREIHLGDVAAMARQADRRISRARHRRRTAGAILGDRIGRHGRYRPRQSDGPQRQDSASENGIAPARRNSSGRFRNGATRSSAIARGPIFKPMPPRPRSISSNGRWPKFMPAG